MLRELHAELGIPASYRLDTGLPTYVEPAELVEIGPNLVGRMQRLTPEAARQWQGMVAEADKVGIQLLIVSGFRGIDYQAGGFRPHVGGGDIGCAVDIATPGSRPLTEEFEDTDAYRWLESRAIEFGFSMTYPRDNPWGIAFEPWHWSLKG